VGDWIVDAALFTFAAVLGALGLGYVWPGHGVAVDAVGTAVGVLACLALWVRRASPAANLATIAAAAFSPLAAGAGLVAVCTAAARARGRTLAVAVIVVAVSSVVFPILNPALGELVPVKQSFPAVLFTVGAFSWGFYLRVRREQVASLRERASQLEAAQEHRAELARQAERRRIAREMHDVLAHRLSLLSVHAGALEFRPDASAAEIAQAAAVIRASASAALSDLREVVTVLREDTAGPPAPSFAQIPALIEESRAAGMTVEGRIEVQDAESLTAAVGRTAYRVVQEGLTNARKHAPGAAVAVTVASNGRPGLLVEITSAGSAVAAGQGTARLGAGAGLIGLAERVALVGGTLKHQTGPAGEFVLRATIPRPS
jgi:signal transduction histidine kinase